MNRNHLVAAMLATLASAGCAVDQWDGITYVDDRFSADEQLAIQQAADMWDVATDGVIHFNLVFGQLVTEPNISSNPKKPIEENPAHTIVRADESNAPPLLRDGDAFGTVVMETRKVIVMPDKCPNYLTPCFAHELGHSAGMVGHVENDETAIMNGEIRAENKCITRSDIAYVCSLHDCRGRKLKPCG